VIREMEQNIKRYNLDFIGIIDDNFVVNSKRIQALAINVHLQGSGIFFHKKSVKTILRAMRN